MHGQAPASQREILLLRSNMSRSYGEIAKELGVKIGTVKSRIGRARETLRALISESCPEMDSRTMGSGWFEPVRKTGRVAVASC